MQILVVDDEAAMREVLEMRLSEWGYRVTLAGSADEARGLAERGHPDAVISDVVLPGASGLELLQSLKAGDRERPVLLITAYGSIDEAVEAMKLGAHDFLTKPLDYGKLEATLAALAAELARRGQVRRLDAALERGAGLSGLVGRSAPMKELFRMIEAVAASDAAVIICGESGTGKELVARAVHDLSKRAHGPFIAVNVAAIPEGLAESELFGHEKGAFSGAVAARPGCFELAHGGTLFLDEITEMPSALQTKLLRVLEGGAVRRVGGSRETNFDVRVAAATNRDPAPRGRAGDSAPRPFLPPQRLHHHPASASAAGGRRKPAHAALRAAVQRQARHDRRGDRHRFRTARCAAIAGRATYESCATSSSAP